MKAYTIKEGSHSSGFHFRPVIGNSITMVGSFKFNYDCLYDLKNTNNFDMNKLVGFSMGYHMNNSIRIGWRCKGNDIELFSFIHQNGKIITADINTELINRQSTYLSTVKPGETIKFSIAKLSKNYCIIQLLDTNNKVLGTNNIWFQTKVAFWNVGYMLYPYFGGNTVAPHEMSIELEYKFIQN